jgi:hypothetical protein
MWRLRINVADAMTQVERQDRIANALARLPRLHPQHRFIIKYDSGKLKKQAQPCGSNS